MSRSFPVQENCGFFVGEVFMQCRKLIDKLNREKHLDFPEWVTLWSRYTGDDRIYAGELARAIALKHFASLDRR